MKESICPKCGKPYTGYPALSRIDRTAICPDCGVKEALAALGMDTQEQEEILEIIRRNTQ